MNAHVAVEALLCLSRDPDLDRSIDAALRVLGEGIGASRVYIFSLDLVAGTMTNTHEWCAPGVTPQITRLVDIPTASLPWWMDNLPDSIVIDDVAALPPEAEAERQLLESQDIRSLVVHPIVDNGNMMGFVGFDNVDRARAWDQDALGLLDLFSDAVAGWLRQMRSLRELEALASRYQLAVEGANDAVWEWSPSRQRLSVSRGWCPRLGLRPDRELGCAELAERLHPEDLGALMQAWNQFRTSTERTFTAELRVGGGEAGWTWVLARSAAVRDDAGKLLRVAGTLTDISARKELEDVLRHRCAHDALTGLPNRSLFLERLTQRRARALRQQDWRYGVLYLDLDGFKTVNDVHGHHVGDRLLAEIGERFRATIRLSDTVARLGGDEFAVLLDQVSSLAEAAVLGRRLEATVARPITVLGVDVVLGASMGISLADSDDIGPELVLVRADKAMYAEKHLRDDPRHS